VTPVPTITGISVDRSELWPPNHKMADVDVYYTLSGPVCMSAQTSLSIVSSEPVGRDEMIVRGPHKVSLASERDGTGPGRVYTITISATNDGITVATETITVTVPHDQGRDKRK
jgi:hypothetical protein